MVDHSHSSVIKYVLENVVLENAYSWLQGEKGKSKMGKCIIHNRWKIPIEITVPNCTNPIYQECCSTTEKK